MIDAIWKWLLDNYPGIVIVLTISLVVWKISRWYFKFEERIRKCESFDNLIEDVKTDIHSIHKDIDGVKMDIKSIKDYLVNKDQSATSILAMKNSPMVLNDNGSMIYNIVNGDRFITENQDVLLSRIADKKPRTLLDVEIAAKEVCLDLLSNPIFDGIKNIVYNHPAVKIKKEDGTESDYVFTIADVCFVLSLPLRDIYLKVHPNFEDVSDIDKK